MEREMKLLVSGSNALTPSPIPPQPVLGKGGKDSLGLYVDYGPFKPGKRSWAQLSPSIMTLTHLLLTSPS